MGTKFGIALFALALGFFSTAQAQDACTNATVAGNYGFTINGQAPGSAVFASVGTITLDGQGNVCGSDTFSSNGSIGQRFFCGTYVLNPNCNGSIVLNDSLGLTFHLNFVVVKNGKEFQFIQADPGVVVTGIARR